MLGTKFGGSISRAFASQASICGPEPATRAPAAATPEGITLEDEREPEFPPTPELKFEVTGGRAPTRRLVGAATFGFLLFGPRDDKEEEPGSRFLSEAKNFNQCIKH